MPLVSVIVPIYNAEKYIRRCIESIQKQTFYDIEILFIDDCSPDNSLMIVNEYAGSDKRVRVICHEHNMGPMCARRSGYEMATGKYITFCDSDDSLPEDALETLYSVAEKENAEIVSGNITYINQDLSTIEMNYSLKYGCDKESVYHSLLLNEYGHNLCSKLFARSLFEGIEYYAFEHYTNGEDGCLFYQVVSNSSKIIHTNKSVYNYYQNMQSSSHVKLTKTGLEGICLLNSIRVETIEPYKELKFLLEKVVSNVLCNLYYKGYNKDGYLDEIIDRYSLNYYKSFRCIMKIRPFSLMIKLVTKRYLIRKYNS